MEYGRLRLGEILVGENLCTVRDIADALSAQVVEGSRLGTILVQRELVRLDDVGRCLSLQHGVPHANEGVLRAIPPEALASVPRSIVKKHLVLPLRFEAGSLILAMIDPRKTVADVVSFAVGTPVRACVVPELRLQYYLEKLYGLEREPRFLRQGPERARPSSPGAAPTPAATPEAALRSAPIEGAEGDRPSAPNDRRRLVKATIAPPLESNGLLKKRDTLPFGFRAELATEAGSPTQTLAARLDAAESGAAIAELLVEPILEGTKASILFWVRGAAAVGCCARGVKVADTDVRHTVVSLEDPSLLQWAIDAQGAVCGETGAASVEGELAKKLAELEPGEVCVAPVILKERVVNLVVILAEPGKKFPPAALDDLRIVCEHASRAYQRIGERLRLHAGPRTKTLQG